MRGERALETLADSIDMLDRIASTTVVPDLVDLGAKIHACHKKLEALNDSICTTLKKDHEGEVEGHHYKAVIIDYEQERLDTKSLKAKVPERIWRPFLNIIAMRRIDYKVA